MPVPKLRTRDSSAPPQSVNGSSISGSPLSRVSSRLSMASESLSKTLTPGELTLAASRQELEILTETHPDPVILKQPSVEDLSSRVDLIALDSPFVSDPPDATPDVDFKDLWEAIGDGDARGWYDASVEKVIERLQGLRNKITALFEPLACFLVDTDRPP
ncbi:hypothetical protein H0H81_004885 [Sphagnurus paluster]|uniref:Uncharacterized protein n=1 Tax=Sphagnurus paluster TaxID=117069 RepID=A0A9P7GSQ7_9AGAR|nr:hypothetical protein H0H81_004885 [Sphagnurus paluster]